ncbi:MAG TPA: DUF1640 domain-containing protein [Gammaproteobacteria bacterium]|jgi:uncharacterized membrane protein YqiK|nr:DUF1640 domain-containing protein [Gammaproteobacteria bacterium]MBT3490501.1 DUF1640 domain-containing protein [Gammaproteobacteria bacterium]MBT3717645.1 DUF1640 domain-containing protein [Gammaproteobacteria bacterium]MBT3844698.1 DUF1640 domain-containing protein [Gammaproteobacteria bacterium]MBT3892111.1 DUF1640 domain-containing protein [Gammaproteobacteria bacterium]
MSTTTFDTLQFVERLTQAGISPEHAKAEAEALKDALKSTEIVSKADLQIALAELHSDLIKWIAGLAFAQIALLVALLLK